MFRIGNATRALKALGLSASLLLVLVCAGAASAQTTSFTYQGRLIDGGTAANGNYDLQFALFDAVSGGAQIGATQTVPTVAVSAGIFSVQLDFGASAFPGANRFLEIGARLSGAATFTTLSPRQQISSTPYAIRSLNASSADAVTVNGVPGGSGNYIQNATTPQASANFNISGSGTAGGTLSANIVNATTQYNIGGGRVLSVNGSLSTFAGVGAGNSGQINAFFGANAGHFNQGDRNSFFGAFAGANNNLGGGNSFFGFQAGTNNTANIAVFNTFLGDSTGLSNTTEAYNTFIGASANGAPGITYATAIGANASVTQSNSLVLGSITGLNGSTSDTKVGIGTPSPAYPLTVTGNASANQNQGAVEFNNAANDTGVRIRNTAANGRVWTLFSSGGTTGLCAGCFSIYDATVGQSRLSVDPNGNVGIGIIAPTAKLEVTSGDVYVQTQGKGIILRATDGANCYRVTVNNVGALASTLVPCP